MRGSDEIEAFWQGLPRWRRELGALPPSRLLPPAPDLAALARTVSRLERRHRDGPECPLRAAFFGPTGAGKSKIFNSLLGETVSPAGFHRPYTRRALFWVHEDWRPIVASLEGEIRTHARSEWRGVFLIDTPDFDSVELANRDEAERVFHEADLFLFIVDSLKYADASSWEWLERIHATGKPYRLVLNKVRAAEVTRDFAERIERVLGGGPAHPVIVLPDLPIDDDTPIPPDTPGLVELRELLLRSSSDPAETRRRNIELFARDLDKVFVRSRELLALIENRKKALERLHSAIAERARTAVGELEDRLITDVDPAVKRELYGRVLERIERLDVLRYPRRLLSLPAEGLREL
ncbi:MAG TPA: GTPase, partial [Planctomycetota bacterium]|nr:GTPase [Planctomycetota bacterium]